MLHVPIVNRFCDYEILLTDKISRLIAARTNMLSKFNVIGISTVVKLLKCGDLEFKWMTLTVIYYMVTKTAVNEYLFLGLTYV